MGMPTSTRPLATRGPSLGDRPGTRLDRSSGTTRRPIVRRVLFLLVLLATSGPAIAAAQTADNLLLVINDTSPASQQIGAAYASRRAIPPNRVLHITTPVKDAIERATYLHDIEAPLAQFLVGKGLQDRILYVVLTKGVPLRVVGTGGP